MACLCQDDGVAGDDTDEEGTAEDRSQSLGSDSDEDAGAADDSDSDDEAAGRRLNIRTSALRPAAAVTLNPALALNQDHLAGAVLQLLYTMLTFPDGWFGGRFALNLAR